MKSKTLDMTMIALMTVVIIICSQIMIPMTIILMGPTHAPVLAMAMPGIPGIRIPVQKRISPRVRAMILGLVMIFLGFTADLPPRQ